MAKYTRLRTGRLVSELIQTANCGERCFDSVNSNALISTYLRKTSRKHPFCCNLERDKALWPPLKRTISDTVSNHIACSKIMPDYIDEHWRSILVFNGLTDFESFWELEAPWFEEPNHRRGGWSGVSRCELKLPDGGTRAIFLKRQENHCTFSWRAPFRGIPTFCREFKHIMNYQSKSIPSLNPVYFAVRRTGKDRRAILITEELTGFTSLEDIVDTWLKGGAPSRVRRRHILKSVAELVQRMHGHGIQHSCLLAKHVFVRQNADGSVNARVIDLEKSRWRPFRTLCAMRDLHSLNRFSSCWNLTDRLWFFKEYLAISHLTPYAKWLWRNIGARSVKKNRIRTSPQAILSETRDTSR